MSEDYNMIPEENFEELRSRLKSLPKAKAPENFSHNLFARIEQMESAEKGNVIELPKPAEQTRSFWQSFRPAYGIAAAVVIGFIIYQLYPAAKRIQLQQSAPEVAQSTTQQAIPQNIPAPSATQSQLRAAPSQKPERTPSVAAVTRHETNNRVTIQDTRRPNAAATAVAAAPMMDRNAALIQQNAERQAQAYQQYMNEQAQLMQSAAQLPPDLFRQSRPPSGAQLTTVSSGIAGSRSYDSLNAVDRTPWGAFNALQRGRDSLRLRDSLKTHHPQR